MYTILGVYSFSAYGGIQLGCPQKIGLFGPPPPLVRIFVLKGQTPSHLGCLQSLTPPPKKRKTTKIHGCNFKKVSNLQPALINAK